MNDSHCVACPAGSSFLFLVFERTFVSVLERTRADTQIICRYRDAQHDERQLLLFARVLSKHIQQQHRGLCGMRGRKLLRGWADGRGGAMPHVQHVGSGGQDQERLRVPERSVSFALAWSLSSL